MKGMCISGTWGAWRPWGDCSATCGEGTMDRKRECEPGDAVCPGVDTQTRLCYSDCPANSLNRKWDEVCVSVPFDTLICTSLQRKCDIPSLTLHILTTIVCGYLFNSFTCEYRQTIDSSTNFQAPFLAAYFL